jgi:hypothetical protein
LTTEFIGKSRTPDLREIAVWSKGATPPQSINAVQRELVSKDQLTRILTERMQQLPGCAECYVTHITRLDTPSDDGRNWLARTRGEHCWGALLQVFATAQHEFNLVE